jgi:hypothetical protein
MFLCTRKGVAEGKRNGFLDDNRRHRTETEILQQRGEFVGLQSVNRCAIVSGFTRRSR